ncbi:MAG: hypothetical protein PVI24_16100 [Myxococcales bacterium]
MSRERFTLSDLLSRASEAWSRDLATWVLAVFLYWLLGIGIPASLGMMWGFFSTIQQTGGETGPGFDAIDAFVRVALQVIQLVLSAVFTLGMWAMAVRGLHRHRTTLGVLFSQMSKIWKYIVQSLVVMLAAVLIVLPVIVIIFLAFVGPVSLDTPMSEILDDAGRPFGFAALVLLPLYVYLTTGIAFMQAELAFNDDAGPIEAIVSSWRIAQGKRWRIIGIGLVSGFIFVGSAMLCGIGLLFGAPFALLLFAALYLALRNGADVPSPNTSTTLGRRY